ncbi:MAG: hypothetical protein COV35_04245 [Alphaproteobacteria bacterium CG11_big_fil_rev_8_21_14_0_20_39_49]|nr:MAG: hypothetical protein COV35_04245 [Alphaproteobacteria bacterium CG11_big_fil_rev_8_21_14_0_20_39_49]
MKITNLYYKFLQSFLVLTLFFTVFCYSTPSNAANYNFFINQNDGDVSIAVTPTFVPGVGGLKLEMKPASSPDTAYAEVATLLAAPYDWGTLSGISAGRLKFKVSDPLLGIAETHDVIVHDHSTDQFVFDYTVSGNNLNVQLLPGTVPFGDGAGNFINKMTLEYKLFSAPDSAYSVINTFNYPTEPGSYNLLFNTTLADGTYTLRATAEYTVTSGTKAPRSETITISIGQASATPAGGGGFPSIANAFTFDDLSENSGNLLITTTYTGSLPLESVKLFMERPTAPGVWEEVGAIITSPPSTITWDHLTYPLLAGLPSGMYNFKVEGVSYNPSSPASKFNPFAETPFEVIGSILDIATEEITFGNIGVEVTVLDPSVTVSAVKLYIKDISTATWDPVGHFIREDATSVGGPFLWGSKNPTFNDVKLEKLDPGDYTLKAETEISNPNGSGTIIIDKELDFTVFGVPIEFSYDEVNKDIGIEIIPVTALNANVNNISLFIKGISEPDSAYQLVRHDSTPGYEFGILDVFYDDTLLMNMALGTYNAKVELTATGQGDPANYVQCDAEVDIFTNCLISHDTSTNTVELLYEETFEFQVQDIVTDAALVALLDELFAKEFEFEVKILNSEFYSPSENLNHVGVRLIPSTNIDLAEVNWVNLRIAAVPPGMSGGTPVIQQHNTNAPEYWKWGLFYMGGMAHPSLLNLPVGEYMIQSEINMTNRTVTKQERIRISDDVETDGSILGDRVGTPIDIP